MSSQKHASKFMTSQHLAAVRSLAFETEKATILALNTLLVITRAVEPETKKY